MSKITKELHFYPKNRLLLYLQLSSAGKAVLARCEAVGGPAKLTPDPNHPSNPPLTPTDSGRFIIEQMEKYHTPTWGTSRLKWGVELKDMGHLKTPDVYYRLPNGKWGSMLNDFGYAHADIKATYKEEYGKDKIPEKWVFNDFGPVAVRYYRDHNNNKVFDNGERLEGEMIHTTNVDEADHAMGRPFNLSISHGCIHIRPADRDKFIAVGAFDRGRVFIIHGYHENYRP